MTGNDVKYTYGTSGNETGRFLFWTEDCYGCEHRLCQSNVVSNRMHAAVDEKYSSYYVHDHSGERRESRDQSQACLSYAETKQSVRSDHLGSASWITDNGGLAVQHLQYLPYGERYVDQRTAGYNERFTFTGKEKDSLRLNLQSGELCRARLTSPPDLFTSYYYFGARYMDHELMTMWLSVDPMADKYPNISPYAYCAWNPVRLVDPDGGKIKISGNIIYSPNMKSDGCDDFDKTAIDALNHLYSSEEGALMINKLCEYDGDIGIYEDFYTNYQVNGPETSFYNENEGKPGTGIFSEITINWNIENPESVPTLNGMQANATYNLLDEICHAYDLCTGYGTLAKTEEGDYKAEFQAVYRSNVVRHQLNDNNYRSQYYTNSKDSKGAGQKTARRRNNENVFYQPSWYPRCDTDNVSILSQGF